MIRSSLRASRQHNLGRRDLLACASMAAIHPARATASPVAMPGSPPSSPSSEYRLSIRRKAITIDGKTLAATTIDGTVPGPILRWREGDSVRLDITNTLDEPSSIHWHGIRLPSGMDGVPGLSFAGIAPGETFTYRFPVRQNGTYWYHSHSGGQEAKGLTGAIVIDPATPDPRDQCARDYVIMLGEWTDVAPADIVSNLKMQDDYYIFRQRSLASLPAQARQAGGILPALGNRLMWSRMRMAATDIADVSGIIYSYTLNGMAASGNWTGLFQPGERIRLRFINASTMTFFDVRIPGLSMRVVAADGNAVEPVDVDMFRIGVAETYDVIITPRESGAYTIFAQSEDRTGFARGTLATAYGMSAPLPPMDPRPVRSMVDMGMGGMQATHAPPPSSKTTPTPPMGGMTMPGMDMANMDMGGMEMAGKRMAGMPMQEQDSTAGRAPIAPEIDDPGPPPLNVENQNIAAMPIDRTGSPGDGLENLGRRVLTYRMLRARRPASDPRPPSREIILHLTGNMERYIWGFNGRKFSESGPIRLRLGERVRFTLINDTMMEHPIHLHGMWSELENGQGEYRPVKHTVIAQPGSKLSYLVTADAPGAWAFHCHLLYHMDQGMFRTVLVS